MPEKRDALRLLLLGALLLAPILACNMPAEMGTGGPTVTIVSPADGSTVVVGQQVLIQSTASDGKGISRVELIVNVVPIRADPPLEEVTTLFAIVQPWFPDTPGDVVVQVIAYNIDNQASLPASITLHIVESAAGATPAPAPTSTPVPDVTAESGCTLNASFAADVTIPDESELQPGVSFVKTWRIRNSGTCDWEAGFHLVFVGGDQLGAPASVSAPATVSGASADVSVPMTAPSARGSYKGNWRMQSADGQVFGSTVWVIIVVPSPVTATPVPTSTPTPTRTSQPTATTTPPAAPSDLTMTTLPSGYVSLVWKDNASDEQGFHVLANGAILHTVGADAGGWDFMYSDYADVWCDQTVSLTVVAYKGDKWSAPSNEVQYVGPPCPPPIVAQGSGLTLALGECIDLDSGGVEPLGPGSEMLWQKPGGTLFFRAVNGTKWASVGVGSGVPSYAGCSSTPRTATGGLSVPTLQVGMRLCIDTTEGNLAGLRVDEIRPDEELVISFVTWEGP